MEWSCIRNSLPLPLKRVGVLKRIVWPKHLIGWIVMIRDIVSENQPFCSVGFCIVFFSHWNAPTLLIVPYTSIGRKLEGIDWDEEFWWRHQGDHFSTSFFRVVAVTFLFATVYCFHLWLTIDLLLCFSRSLSCRRRTRTKMAKYRTPIFYTRFMKTQRSMINAKPKLHHLHICWTHWTNWHAYIYIIHPYNRRHCNC